MKDKVKRKPIAATVTKKIFIILTMMCVCLSFGIQNAFYREMSSVEQSYMAEVIRRVALEVNNELNTYVNAASYLGKSKTIQEYLDNLEQGVLEEGINVQKSGDFSHISGYDTALAEIKETKSMLGSSVLFITICSIYQDDYFNDQEQSGGEGYTLSNRLFYDAYTTRSSYITDPYAEVVTGTTIISIAEPIWNEEGRVTGILLIQLDVSKLISIVTNVQFGASGVSMLMDRNNNIIAYSNPALVGMNISQLDYSGENTATELANPTGTVIEYNFAGDDRIGGIVEISPLSGWKMILALAADEFKSGISVVTLRLNAALVVATIVCSLCCAKMVFTELAPMKKLEEFMEELAKGRLTKRVEYDAPNEIGNLARHMNLTAESLERYIGMIETATYGLSEGNLLRPQNIDFHGDFRRIENAIENHAFTLSDSIREIRQSVTQVNIGAEQVAIGSQMIAEGAAEQSLSVERLHHLIEDINVAILVTAKNSSNVTTDAQSISDNLLTSNEKMQELVVSVQDIRAMSDEVKRIIKTIEEVAFQTNILSLNASVEAARAGSAGRGFAVVADQVRLLSGKTAEAAEETNKIVTEIATAIETGTDLAQSTSKDLQQVVDDVDVFVGNISSISLSTKNQAEAITEINQGIENISKVVEQNSTISEESAASSEELSAQSCQMLTLVEHYQLVPEAVTFERTKMKNTDA